MAIFTWFQRNERRFCDAHLAYSVSKTINGARIMPTEKSIADKNGSLSVIAHERSRLHEICDELELIADQLGGQVNVQLYKSILNSLRDELPLYHRDEEALFNLLLERKPADKVLAKRIELAVSEHSTIESYAFELAEPIGNVIAGNDLSNVEAAGYLLRCCFEITRQHLRWEDVTLFGGREYAIKGADKIALKASLIRNRHNLPAGVLRITT